MPGLHSIKALIGSLRDRATQMVDGGAALPPPSADDASTHHTSEASRRIVAVIDVGSTSVRCSVAEVSATNWSLVEDIERPLELLPAIRGRRFSRANMDDVVRACSDVLNVARSYGVEATRAVAGPALKDVVNCDALFEYILATLGLHIEMIDGAEEGRIYHQALTWVLREEKRELRGHALLLDLGSTTSSVSVLNDGRLVHTIEDHFATHRVAFNLAELRDSEEFLYSVDSLARGAVRVTVARLAASSFQSLFVTGREPRFLRRRLREPRDTNSKLLPELTRSALDEAFENLMRLSPADRLKWSAHDDTDLPASMTALCFMRHLCAETGVERVCVPELQLRLGLLTDFLPHALGPYRLPRAELVAAAERLVLRFGMNLDYARNTARWALEIFDATQPFHMLPARDRSLLEFASMVHDLGAYVNVRGRHKHTYYIIKGVDIAGMSAEEREIVAQVARYHRGRPPQNTHEEFRRLDQRGRALVSYLAAILRVAYALDVDRTQRISKLSCDVEGQKFMIAVNVPNVVLERWAMGRKAELFRDVFGLEVCVVPSTE